MTQKHTPTPWQLEWHSQGHVVIAESKHRRGHIYRHNVVVIGGETQNRELLDANAEFIVLACNAHDELVKLIDDLCKWDDANSKDPYQLEVEHPTRERADAILAKARGEV